MRTIPLLPSVSGIKPWQVAVVAFLAAPLIVLWLARTEKPEDSASRPAAQRELSTLEKAKHEAVANPGHDTYLELGLQYYRSRRLQEAIAATRKALEFDPNSAVAYNNLCSAYAELGMWDRAVQACRKALSIAPNFQLAKNNLAWALREQALAAPRAPHPR